MNALRAPLVAGVAGGVGTSTIAAALRGHDLGRRLDPLPDVLACRCAGDSLRAAARAVGRLVELTGSAPYLVVTTDDDRPARGPLRARLRMVEPQVAGLVVLPWVPRWRALADPVGEALDLFAIEGTPRHLRAYRAALAGLAADLATSGRLHRPPSALPRPGGAQGAVLTRRTA